MKAPLPSFTRLTLAVGAPKRKCALDDTGPSVLHDIWHKYTPGVLGDHEYERVMGEYDNDLHDNMQVLDVVMDIDLYLYLAGIDSYLDARDQDLANPNQTFWEGSNGELWKSVKDNKEQFTPPPVILELQVKTERTRAGDPRGYEVFRHEGRHRAWLAKYKYGYQRILVTVGVRWTTSPPGRCGTLARCARTPSSARHRTLLTDRRMACGRVLNTSVLVRLKWVKH